MKNRGKCKTKESRVYRILKRKTLSGTLPARLRCGCYRARAVVSGAFGEPHNRIFDLVRVRDLAENEAFFFTGSLYVHIAEVENRRDDSLDGRSDILDARKGQLTYLADKQPFLFDVDNAFTGDDPDIEVIIDPGEEAEQPQEDEESAFDKNEKADALSSGDFRKEERQKKKAGDEQEQKEQDGQEVSKNIEPVAVNDVEDLFILSLPLKMISIESVCHMDISVRMREEGA